jgi:DNA-binding response OmpR family regulator
MNHKVLLADDSLTIQKVIKITLANQPFDIVDCVTDDELFKKLPEVQPELVFLDFNLSEKYSGYELAAKIKAAAPNARILLLLGTFDTVDETSMEKCGASDKIVKPFDSNKFIAICKRLVDTAPLEELKFPEPKKEEFIVPIEDDHWKISHTTEQVTTDPAPQAMFDVRNHLNPLDQQINDWGMSVPNIINGESTLNQLTDLPPVIGEVKSLHEHKNKLEIKVNPPTTVKDDIKFPQNDDLDYPTIEDLEVAKAPASEEKTAPKSKLISIETFNMDSEAEFEIEHSINSMEETDVSSIEAQIRDEVEEDLWKVDEFEDLKKEVAAKIEEVKSNLQNSTQYFDESLFKPIDESDEIQWNTSQEPISFEAPAPINTPQAPSVNMQEIETLIKKHVKEYMDEMFKQKVEKIAWEVIPDLAENLIRQEMTKISNKILNDSN